MVLYRERDDTIPLQLNQWPAHMLTIANHKIHSNVTYILDSRFRWCSFSFAYSLSFVLFHIQCHSQSTNKCICVAIYGFRIHIFILMLSLFCIWVFFYLILLYLLLQKWNHHSFEKIVSLSLVLYSHLIAQWQFHSVVYFLVDAVFVVCCLQIDNVLANAWIFMTTTFYYCCQYNTDQILKQMYINLHWNHKIQ